MSFIINIEIVYDVKLNEEIETDKKIYKHELKQEYPNAFKNDYSLEVRIYNLITHYLYEGVSYTQEHLKDLSEALRITFGDNWSLSTKKIGEILNQIYNIECKTTRIATVKNYLFYKNILPNGVAKKTIKSLYN